MRLDGAVEGGFGVVDAADHGDDGAIRLHHHHRGFMGVGLLTGLAEDDGMGCAPRRILQFGLQRGAHGEIAADRLAAGLCEAQGFVARRIEIIVAGFAGGAVHHHARMVMGFFGLILCDRLGVDHGA